MRRKLLVALAAAAMLGLGTAVSVLGLGTTAASADSNAFGDSGWILTPQSPRDVPAGVCTFPVHFGIPFDDVKGRVLETYPDGSVKQEEFNGPLIVTVTNLNTGASTNVNASGTGVLNFEPDGSQIFDITGPVLVGFREGFANNHPTGLFVLTGHYELLLTATGRTLVDFHGTEHDVCADIS